MAIRPEVLAQLARILADDSLRLATDEEVRQAVDRRLQDVVAALVAEAADSEAVFDRDSALAYLQSRLRDLAAVLTTDQVEGLRRAAARSIDSW